MLKEKKTKSYEVTLIWGWAASNIKTQVRINIYITGLQALGFVIAMLFHVSAHRDLAISAVWATIPSVSEQGVVMWSCQ